MDPPAVTTGGTSPASPNLRAVEVPLAIARAALQVAEYAEELYHRGYRSAREDASSARDMALTSARTSITLATANLPPVNPDENATQALRRECLAITERAREKVRRDESAGPSQNEF